MPKTKKTITIGSVIREFRTKRGLSGRELSTMAGISSGLISMLESGTNENISIKILAKIAAAMSTRASVLLRTMEQANQ